MSDRKVEAAELFRKSAQLDDHEAQFKYGECLRDGKGVPQNQAEAQRWFQKAANAGHTGARQALDQLHPPQTAQPQTPAPVQPTPSGTTPGTGKGGTYALVAAVVAFIVFANSCKEKTSGDLFSGDFFPGPNWGAVAFGTAVVTFIAYIVGKNAK